MIAIRVNKLMIMIMVMMVTVSLVVEHNVGSPDFV